MNTSELVDRALRYAVALARKDEGYRLYQNCAGRDGWEVTWGEGRFPNQRAWLRDWPIEQDWGLAGPIVERENLEIGRTETDWRVQRYDFPCVAYGPTPLEAACRCFVRSRLGDEIDVPEELI